MRIGIKTEREIFFAIGYIFIYLVSNAVLILVNLAVAVFQYGLSCINHGI